MTNEKEQQLRTLLTEFYDEVEECIDNPKRREDSDGLNDLKTSISDVIAGLNNWNERNS